MIWNLENNYQKTYIVGMSLCEARIMHRLISGVLQKRNLSKGDREVVDSYVRHLDAAMDKGK